MDELSTLLLLGVVGADLVDGRALAPQQRHLLRRHIQLVNASDAVLVPEQEVLIVAKAKGVVQLLPFVHRLADQRTKQQDYTYKVKLKVQPETLKHPKVLTLRSEVLSSTISMRS